MTDITAPRPDSGSNVVMVNRGVAVRQSQETGVTLTDREYQRYLDCLEHCQPQGWADLWLAVTGIGGGLAISAWVTVVVLPSSTSPADKDILRMLVVLGALVLVLSLVLAATLFAHGPAVLRVHVPA